MCELEFPTMKRSVAILGPTPSFVRWAIRHDCPLRQQDTQNLPDATFRQLRGLRELSVGVVESRVWEGICVHPQATSTNPEEALGFPIDEVLDVHGDEEFVANGCQSCPANAVARDQPGIWAGCYGWLPASNDFSFEITSRQLYLPDDEPAEAQGSASRSGEKDQLIRLLDSVIDETGLVAESNALFPMTTPRWYGLWQNHRLNPEQVEFLLRVFETLVARLSKSNPEIDDGRLDWIRFLNALRTCSEYSLELHVELIPPGFSDGTTWTQFAHCPACKCEMGNVPICPACERRGNPHGERKGKVLGLRPYVKLCGVLGESGTRELLERFKTQQPGMSGTSKRD